MVVDPYLFLEFAVEDRKQASLTANTVIFMVSIVVAIGMMLL